MLKSWKTIKYTGGWGLDYREIGYVLGKRLIHHHYGIEMIDIGADISITGAELVSKGEADVGITRPPAIKWALKGIAPFKTKLENLPRLLLGRDPFLCEPQAEGWSAVSPESTRRCNTGYSHQVSTSLIQLETSSLHLYWPSPPEP